MRDPRQPILVGVAQITQRPGERSEPLEPLALMEAAARAAAQDTGAGTRILDEVGSLTVVDSVSWPVGDPGRLVAERLGIAPRETVRTGMGGNSPQAAVNDLAARMAAGRLDAALIVGAEAMATLMPYAKAGESPGWAEQDPQSAPDRVLAAPRPGSSAIEDAAGLIAPVTIYPVLEHAVRGAAGRSRSEQVERAANLWARHSAVAAENPNAWSREARSATEIATVTDENRRVSDPYLKLMNANITVDMGAALILCTVEAALRAGIATDRWVFLHAGAQAEDHWFVSERDDLARSPALRAAGRAALHHARADLDDVALLDLYACFPSAVQIAAAELGLDLDDASRPPTVTGGLTFGGGPGNNAAMHAIATLAGRLREHPGALGLVTALGWYVTKHAVGVYSTRPPANAFRALDLQYEVEHLPRREVVAGYRGPATIEAYTTLFERDGSPGMGVVVARLADGRRALGKSHDPDAIGVLADGAEPLGRRVELDGGNGYAPA